MIRFPININPFKVKGNTYIRLVIAKHLDELGWEANDEVLVEIDKKNKRIVIRKKGEGKDEPIQERCW